MSEPLASGLCLYNFNPALVADDPPVLHSLVLAANTLPVFYRAEYLGAEEAVPFRPESPVIDRFRFLYFSIRPCSDFLGRGKSNFDSLKFRRVFGLFKY